MSKDTLEEQHLWQIIDLPSGSVSLIRSPDERKVYRFVIEFYHKLAEVRYKTLEPNAFPPLIIGDDPDWSDPWSTDQLRELINNMRSRSLGEAGIFVHRANIIDLRTWN